MREINVHELADGAKFNRFHAKVLAWCFLVIIIDGYDLAVAGAALPAIMKEMGVEAATAGFMASSALFGMMFGAIFLGALSDKIGRRWTISLCVFLFSVFTAAAGLTKDPVTFSIARFIAGLGIGGVMPNITAQMTEYAPKRIRSFLTTVMFSGYAIGGILAAVLGKQFIAQFGWQIVFFAAGVPVLLIPFILKSMPESLSFLVSSRDSAQLRQIVQSIDPGFKVGADDTFRPPRATNAGSGVTVAQLFQDGRGLSTVMFWVAFFTGLFMIYALSTWLTKLMAMSGYSLGSALSFVIALNVGAVIGSIGGGWLADRFHIKWVVVCMYALGGVFLYMITLKTSTEVLYFIIAAVGACSTGAQIVVYAYSGQYYPSDIRSTGIGMASGIGRMGAIAAPLLIGLIVSLQLPLEQNFLVIGAAGVVGAIALACINHGRSASELTPKTLNTSATM
ncbi:MFS transporter [Achromobacter xylosoxidans]|jgi:AAHS family benzoate transporter-like MFS transporter|uniref:MFS transporter n=1 Tax=Achromobacter spanius TaxID=217203 RepID=A0A2S5GPA1_9BURK|nr:MULTISPECIES: MFS transporter [Achromobacter]AHC49224.1 benzoate MFS transporter BenK [Achromobacter xylosoxidans NBRC 15126 = ATCC 27061]MDD7991184.1 MFS transporter [Achromobacter xylosoxidans]MDQ6211612.1 MFS transporter [Achromobacter insolitus]MDZ5613332.1 MFS transporter [Achromobacter xylosoxidans]MDZ5624562.1 MFS transporter [Achromobacter xylosoxidans]